MEMNMLQLLHIQAAKELRSMASMVKQITWHTQLAEQGNAGYHLAQAEVYRKGMVECRKKYRQATDSIINATANL